MDKESVNASEFLSSYADQPITFDLMSITPTSLRERSQRHSNVLRIAFLYQEATALSSAAIQALLSHDVHSSCPSDLRWNLTS